MKLVPTTDAFLGQVSFVAQELSQQFSAGLLTVLVLLESAHDVRIEERKLSLAVIAWVPPPGSAQDFELMTLVTGRRKNRANL